jgi:hypothetical protein
VATLSSSELFGERLKGKANFAAVGAVTAQSIFASHKLQLGPIVYAQTRGVTGTQHRKKDTQGGISVA